MTDLADRTVLITGASGGLGRPVTEVFLSAGARVVAAALDFPETSARPRCTQVVADLTTTQGVSDMLAAGLEPTGRIDALVHVTGGFAGGEPVHKTDEATWDHMMNLNLKAAFLVTRAVLRPMIDAGYGRLVAVGARAGMAPIAGLSAYNVSKAGLHMLIRTIAVEGKAHGITANAVMPSIIDTPANRKAMPKADFSKWVAPESIARQILWLCSEEASDVSGALLPVYGRS